MLFRSGKEVWYVGDTFANDIVGPSQIGWHTIWLNRRHYPTPEVPPYPDITVKDEEEMCTAIKNLIHECQPNKQ